MKIRNKNTGAEISSPYLIKGYDSYTKEEWFIDNKSKTGCFYISDGWEEAKGVDYAQLEKMVDDALASETKESLLAFFRK